MNERKGAITIITTGAIIANEISRSFAGSDPVSLEETQRALEAAKDQAITTTENEQKQSLAPKLWTLKVADNLSLQDQEKTEQLVNSPGFTNNMMMVLDELGDHMTPEEVVESDIIFYLVNDDTQGVWATATYAQLQESDTQAGAFNIEKLFTLQNFPAIAEPFRLVQITPDKSEVADVVFDKSQQTLIPVLREGQQIFSIDDQGQVFEISPEQTQNTVVAIFEPNQYLPDTTPPTPDPNQGGTYQFASYHPDQGLVLDKFENIGSMEVLSLEQNPANIQITLDPSWIQEGPQYIPEIEITDPNRMVVARVYLEWLAVKQNTPNQENLTFDNFLARRQAGEKFDLRVIARDIDTHIASEYNFKLGSLTYNGSFSNDTLEVNLGKDNPAYDIRLASTKFYNLPLSYRGGQGSAQGIFVDSNSPNHIIFYSAYPLENLWYQDKAGNWVFSDIAIANATHTPLSIVYVTINNQIRANNGDFANTTYIDELNYSPETQLGAWLYNLVYDYKRNANDVSINPYFSTTPVGVRIDA